MLAHVNMSTSRIDGQSHTQPGELGARTLNTITNPFFNNLFDMLDASVDDRERGAVCIPYKPYPPIPKPSLPPTLNKGAKSESQPGNPKPRASVNDRDRGVVYRPYESYPSVPKPPLPPTRKKGGESESQPGNPKPRTLVNFLFPGFGDDSIDCRAADSTSRQFRTMTHEFRPRVSLIGAPPILTQSGRGEDQVVEPRSKPINSASTHSGLVGIFFPVVARTRPKKGWPTDLESLQPKRVPSRRVLPLRSRAPREPRHANLGRERASKRVPG